MNNCHDKIVLITGASSGFGKAIAEQFASLGAKLVLMARRKDKLQSLAKQLADEHVVDAYVIAVDVRDAAQVKQAIADLPEPFCKVDILINNAGLAAGKDKAQHASLDDWETMIDTNVKGLLYLTHALLPTMIERNNGHIINIGSTAGHESYSGGSVYCASKAAVRFFTNALKKDLHGSAIRVTEISPGLAETEFSQVRFKGDMNQANATYENMTPLTADDVADAVIYCATRKPHINIGEMVLFPTDQSGAQLVHRHVNKTSL